MSEAGLWDLFRGASATRTLAIAAELGIADLLADGPRPTSEIAADVGADPRTLALYLQALATDGVFAEIEPGVYGNTETSELLRTGTPLNAFARLYGGVWHQAVGALDASGDKSFEGDFWAWLAEHPRERALFDLAMEDGKERRVDRIAGLDWHDGDTVVDVGGGNGSLLLDFFARRPGLRGIVFDLPETARDEQALAAAGIEFVGGSFFDSVPTGDVYVLGNVLHNWPDDEAERILRTIRRDAPRGARVLVIDFVLQPESAWGGLLGLALFGSRERTEPEWRRLFDAAGLRLEAIVDDRLQQASCP